MHITRNPYLFEEAITDKRQFYGRDSEIKKAIHFVLTPGAKTMALAGPEKTGKTSLLLQLDYQLENEACTQIYFDLRGKENLSLKSLLYEIACSIAAATALPKPSVNDFDDNGLHFSHVFLPAASKAATEERLVLLFDAFDMNLLQAPDKAGRTFIPFFYCETEGKHEISVIFTFQNNVQFNESKLSFEHVISLEGFQQHEAERCIQKSAHMTDLPWDAAAVELVQNYANGHPFLLNAYCHHAWRVAMKHGHQIVSKDTIAAASNEVASLTSPHFLSIWQQLNASEKAVAFAMANGDDGSEISDVLARNKTPLSAGEISQAIRNLTLRGIVEKWEMGGRFFHDIASLLQLTWLLEAAPNEQISSNTTHQQEKEPQKQELDIPEPVVNMPATPDIPAEPQLTSKARYDLAFKALKERNLPAAETALQQLVEADPDYLKGRLLLGRLYEKQKKYVENVALFSAGDWESSDELKFQYTKSLFTLADNSPDKEKIALYRRILNISPNNFQALNKLDALERPDAGVDSGVSLSSNDVQGASTDDPKDGKPDSNITDEASVDPSIEAGPGKNLSEKALENLATNRDREDAQSNAGGNNITFNPRTDDVFNKNQNDITFSADSPLNDELDDMTFSGADDITFSEHSWGSTSDAPSENDSWASLGHHRETDIEHVKADDASPEAPDKGTSQRFESKRSPETGENKQVQEEDRDVLKQKITGLLAKALAFEKKDQWREAVAIYEDINTSFPGNKRLQKRYKNAAIQLELAEKHANARKALKRGDKKSAKQYLAEIILLQPDYKNTSKLLLQATSGIDIDQLQEQMNDESQKLKEAEAYIQTLMQEIQHTKTSSGTHSDTPTQDIKSRAAGSPEGKNTPLSERSQIENNGNPGHHQNGIHTTGSQQANDSGPDLDDWLGKLSSEKKNVKIEPEKNNRLAPARFPKLSAATDLTGEPINIGDVSDETSSLEIKLEYEEFLQPDRGHESQVSELALLEPSATKTPIPSDIFDSPALPDRPTARHAITRSGRRMGTRGRHSQSVSTYADNIQLKKNLKQSSWLSSTLLWLPLCLWTIWISFSVETPEWGNGSKFSVIALCFVSWIVHSRFGYYSKQLIVSYFSYFMPLLAFLIAIIVGREAIQFDPPMFLTNLPALSVAIISCYIFTTVALNELSGLAASTATIGMFGSFAAGVALLFTDGRAIEASLVAGAIAFSMLTASKTDFGMSLSSGALAAIFIGFLLQIWTTQLSPTGFVFNMRSSLISYLVFAMVALTFYLVALFFDKIYNWAAPGKRSFVM